METQSSVLFLESPVDAPPIFIVDVPVASQPTATASYFREPVFDMQRHDEIVRAHRSMSRAALTRLAVQDVDCRIDLEIILRRNQKEPV